MIAFATGGTGLLGSHLVPYLCGEFRTVRLLVRRRPEVSYPSNVEFIHGNLDSEEVLRAGMAACDAVFHLAACVTRWERDAKTYDRVNVEGFNRVMRLALELRVPRVLYTSTFFALGPSGDQPLTETSKPAPGHWHTHYDRTKIAADVLVAELRRQGLSLIRLYPGVIYGPGPLTQGNIVVQLMRDFLARKVPGLLGGGSQVWSFSHVDDVARGHLRAFQAGPVGEDFVLGGDNRSLKEFFVLAASLTGRKPPHRKIPIWAGMSLGAAEESLAWAFGRPPNVTRGMVGAMRHSWACDSSKAQRLLDYQWRSLEEGLRQTIDWMTENPSLKSPNQSR